MSRWLCAGCADDCWWQGAGAMIVWRQSRTFVLGPLSRSMYHWMPSSPHILPRKQTIYHIFDIWSSVSPGRCLGLPSSWPSSWQQRPPARQRSADLGRWGWCPTTSGAFDSCLVPSPGNSMDACIPQGLAACSVERGFASLRRRLRGEARQVARPGKAGLVSGGGARERVDPRRPWRQVGGGGGDDPGQGQEGRPGLGHPLLHLVQRGRLPVGLGKGYLRREEGDKLRWDVYFKSDDGANSVQRLDNAFVKQCYSEWYPQ